MKFSERKAGLDLLEKVDSTFLCSDSDFFLFHSRVRSTIKCLTPPTVASSYLAEGIKIVTGMNILRPRSEDCVLTNMLPAIRQDWVVFL